MVLALARNPARKEEVARIIIPTSGDAGKCRRESLQDKDY
jgi:hypothetical protein